MKNQYTVTIIVPVYNAEDYLPLFFDSYSKQKLMSEVVELVLIDNGSKDESKNIIVNYINNNKHLNIKYYYFDEVAGSYAARNYGIRNSRGDILVFTDSDCIPESDWLENIYNVIKEGIIISGEVEIIIIDKNNIWEVFDSMAHLNNKENADNGKVATANLAVMRSDFLRVGLFSERYSGGDHEWSQRAKRNGLEIVYDEHVKVLHPSRKKFDDIVQKSRRLAYGQGVNYRNKNKSLALLVIVYFLKIFNIRTNIRYSHILSKKGFGIKSIILFNIDFFRTRYAQLSSSIRGYNKVNVRSLDIK